MPATESLSIRKCILIYLIVWLFLSIGYTLLLAPLVEWLFPALRNVDLFVYAWVGGLFLNSGVTLLALAVRIRRVLMAQRKGQQRRTGAHVQPG